MRGREMQREIHMRLQVQAELERELEASPFIIEGQTVRNYELFCCVQATRHELEQHSQQHSREQTLHTKETRLKDTENAVLRQSLNQALVDKQEAEAEARKQMNLANEHASRLESVLKAESDMVASMHREEDDKAELLTDLGKRLLEKQQRANELAVMRPLAYLATCLSLPAVCRTN